MSGLIGRTHLGRLAAPAWQEDDFYRGVLLSLTPERRAVLEKRVTEELARVRAGAPVTEETSP